MDFKIGNCRICISPLFAVMLSLILLIDRTGIMLFGILSVIIHETGHLVFMFLTKKHPEKVVFQLGGIIITSKKTASYNSELLIALGGCLLNFLACLTSGFIYLYNRNEMMFIFSAANFGLMIFNLMPINSLDGMDIIKFSLLKKYSLEKVRSVCNIISLCFLLVASFLSVYSVVTLGLNPTILICLLYLLILTLLSMKN